MDARMPLPCAVGLQWSAGAEIQPALLLEWKQHADKRGHRSWWALVAVGRPSLSHAAITFNMTVEWVPSTALVGLPAGRSWAGKSGQKS